MPFIIWGANILFYSYYTEIWERKYDSKDQLSDKIKIIKQGEDRERKTNVLKSELYTEEDVYSETKRRTIFADKINEFSVNQIATPKRSSYSFLANAGYTSARSSSSSESRHINSISPTNQPFTNEDLFQILEGGSIEQVQDNIFQDQNQFSVGSMSQKNNQTLQFDASYKNNMYEYLDNSHMLSGMENQKVGFEHSLDSAADVFLSLDHARTNQENFESSHSNEIAFIQTNKKNSLEEFGETVPMLADLHEQGAKTRGNTIQNLDLDYLDRTVSQIPDILPSISNLDATHNSKE